MNKLQKSLHAEGEATMNELQKSLHAEGEATMNELQKSLQAEKTELNVALDLAERLGPEANGWRLYRGSFDRIMLSLSSYSQLHAAREFLRSRLGVWTDKLHVTAAGGTGMAEWISTTEDRITIIFTCPVAAFPEELKGPHCDFVAKYVSTNYAFVCDREGSE